MYTPKGAYPHTAKRKVMCNFGICGRRTSRLCSTCHKTFHIPLHICLGLFVAIHFSRRISFQGIIGNFTKDYQRLQTCVPALVRPEGGSLGTFKPRTSLCSDWEAQQASHRPTSQHVSAELTIGVNCFHKRLYDALGAFVFPAVTSLRRLRYFKSCPLQPLLMK